MLPPPPPPCVLQATAVCTSGNIPATTAATVCAAGNNPLCDRNHHIHHHHLHRHSRPHHRRCVHRRQQPFPRPSLSRALGQHFQVGAAVEKPGARRSSTPNLMLATHRACHLMLVTHRACHLMLAAPPCTKPGAAATHDTCRCTHPYALRLLTAADC